MPEKKHYANLSFETAKLVKEKGCKLDNENYYYIDTGGYYLSTDDSLFSKRAYDIHPELVKEWIRKTFGIHMEIGFDAWHKEDYSVQICIKGRPDFHYDDPISYKTYEEALEKALYFTLSKLI